MLLFKRLVLRLAMPSMRRPCYAKRNMHVVLSAPSTHPHVVLKLFQTNLEHDKMRRSKSIHTFNYRGRK